jgi:hypothetical protein
MVACLTAVVAALGFRVGQQGFGIEESGRGVDFTPRMLQPYNDVGPHTTRNRLVWDWT